MTYPYTPNSLNIANGLVTLLSGLKLSDNVTPAYTTVTLGGIKEYLPQSFPYGNILPRKHQSKRKHHGGDITEKLFFEIRGVFDYSNASAAEIQLLTIHDILMPALHAHAAEQGMQGVWHMQVVENSGMFEWLYFKPEWYRLDVVTLEIEQYYLIQGGIIN